MALREQDIRIVPKHRVPDELKLSKGFLSEYKGKQPNWGFMGFGYIIFLRTYSRKVHDENGERYEEWWETVRRFTEGNFNTEWERLRKMGKAHPSAYDKLRRKMERFYYLAFNLLILPPGRGIWISGTEYEKRSGDAMNNCWNVVCKPQPYTENGPLKVSFPFAFLMDEAAKGGGVGVNLQRKHVALIPKVANRVKLTVVCRADHPDRDELAPLGVKFYDEKPEVDDNAHYYMLDDSREGWVEGLTHTMDFAFEGKKKLVIDISDIRERGTDIKTFGGKASGPSPLVDLLKRVNRHLNRKVGKRLTPTDCGDLCQYIGVCIVSGNVRRTAIILISDDDEVQFITSKNYDLEENKEASQWRWASNNSITISPETPKTRLIQAADNIYKNGEPGVVVLDNARNYGRFADGFQLGIDEEVDGFNPCGEIGLPNASPCNLFEVNMDRIEEWIQAGLADESLYEECFTLAAEYAYRVTLRKYDWYQTRKQIEKDRRIGVGITGLKDWVLRRYNEQPVLGFDENDEPIFNKRVTDDLDRFYFMVKSANRAQSARLGLNPSIKLTTVKPSGTLSLLMGVAPGAHDHWDGYMIRRVRIADNHPLIPSLYAAGYPMGPAIIGQDKNGNDVYDPHTLVVEFPIKAPSADNPNFQNSGDVDLRMQCAWIELLQKHWADNSCSVTLTFHKGETPEEEAQVIEDIAWVLERAKNHLKSVSLLPYATGTYKQMPLESITSAEFEEMSESISDGIWDTVSANLDVFDEDADESLECEAGHCPVK